MKEVTVSQKVLYEMMYETIARSAMTVPRDVRARIKQAAKEETSELARLHLNATLQSFQLADEMNGLACADTGVQLYFVKCGDNIRVEDGFSSLYTVSKKAVSDATKNGRLRENVVHPLTREYTGDNTGWRLPWVEFRFDPNIDYLEITGVTKGGGPELFGTFSRVMRSPSMDGRQGVMKFILDSIKEATYAGKSCGPNVIGIGIGGTSAICVHIAQQAALLRPIGNRNPDPEFAKMELDLLDSIKEMSRGPMGIGGDTGVLDVHIELAASHSGNLWVAVTHICSVCRRAVARFGPSGKIEFDDTTIWQYS